MNSFKMRANKHEKKHAYATTVNTDDSWKEELLKKVRELEVARRAAEVNTKKITAENDALNKEVDRLRHIEQFRSVPNSVAQQPPPLMQVPTGKCKNVF